MRATDIPLEILGNGEYLPRLLVRAWGQGGDPLPPQSRCTLYL